MTNYTVITPRRGINDEGKGKKYALHKLISAATTEFVWLQDDDVVPPKRSYSGAVLPQSDLFILPLKMESLSEKPSLLEELQIAEYAAIQELTMMTAKWGRPVMCSGANMIVRRSRWLESYEDLHPEIPSGDDMFLLESFKRRGLTVSVIDEADYTVVVRPQTSLSALFKQRMRWAGKAPKYTDNDINLCGAIVLLANLLQLFCTPFILIKFPIDYYLIKKRDPKISLPVALLLGLIYPYYMLICLLGGFLRRSW